MQKSNAFVTLVMYDKKYLSGAITLAYSLRKTKTKHKIVCMLSIDLYLSQRNFLQSIFDDIICCPYLQYQCDELPSKKQNEIYHSWKNISFTKWYCLSIDKYDKICFLDADLLILKNIDHLFDLPEPAGCFVQYWATQRNQTQPDYYNDIKYGEIISNNKIELCLNQGFVVNGHCILLKPNRNLYNNFLKYMQTYKKSPKCISMFDEVAIVDFLLKQGYQWTQLSFEYNCPPWHFDKLCNTSQLPYIFHYFNKEKPWMMKYDQWKDVSIWWDYYYNAINDYSQCNINQITYSIPKVCSICLFLQQFYSYQINVDHYTLECLFIQ